MFAPKGSKKDKEFCLWVVPAEEGRVKKLRISYKRVAITALCTCGIFFGLIFMAGDYARVQFSLAKNYLSMKQLKKERDNLQQASQVLLSELKDLQAERLEALAYNERIEQRFFELLAILDSVNANSLLGLSPSRGGLGGAEGDCADSDDCEWKIKSEALKPMSSLGSDKVKPHLARASLNLQHYDQKFNQETFLDMLDQQIKVIKQLPIGMPGNGHISSGYGHRRSPFSNQVRVHRGIDFSLPHGSAIKSTGDGVVKNVSRTPTYGLMVDIAHGDRLVTRYAHMSKILVSEGDSICRGEVIGLVGSTGRSTGPHLHYEVLVDGEAQNPMRFIEIGQAIERIVG